MIALAFALSGGLAGVVSLLYVSKTGVLDFQMGVPLAVAGFVGTVVGGMGSLLGAVLGGFALGVASTLLQALLPEALQPSRDAFLYGLVILVLFSRPQGLSRRERWESAFDSADDAAFLSSSWAHCRPRRYLRNRASDEKWRIGRDIDRGAYLHGHGGCALDLCQQFRLISFGHVTFALIGGGGGGGRGGGAPMRRPGKPAARASVAYSCPVYRNFFCMPTFP